MKQFLITLGILVVIGVIVAFAVPRKEQVNSGLTGELNVVFTDDTADIQNVNEVRMSVDRVEIYSASRGWIEVSNKQAEYELLDLKAKGQTKMYASVHVPADTYTQARVKIARVEVEEKDGERKEAMLPGNTISVMSTTRVVVGERSSLKFDVIASDSIHETDGKYVFAPVVHVESRSSAEVSTSLDGSVSISGGIVDANVRVGMDADGSTRENFILDSGINVNFNAGVNAATNVTNDLKSDVNAEGVLNLGGTINY